MQKKSVANRSSQSNQRMVRRRSDNKMVRNIAYDYRSAVVKADAPDFNIGERERITKIIKMIDDSLDFIDSNYLEAEAGESAGKSYIIASASALTAKNMIIATGDAISRETDALIIDDIGYRNYMDLIDSATAESDQVNKAAKLMRSFSSSSEEYKKLETILNSEKIDGSSEKLGNLRAGKTMQLLSSIRDMGGNISYHTSSMGGAGDLFAAVSQYYPRDWCDKSSAHDDVYVRRAAPGEMSSAMLAAYSHNATFTVPLHKGSAPVDQSGAALTLNTAEGTRAVAHELGHRFSNLYPDIKAMELATIADTGRGFFNPLVQGYSTADGDIKIERDISDANYYGDNNRIMVPRNSISDEYAYSFNVGSTPELFPTGVEALFGGGKRTADSVAERDNFALGVLATIR